MVLETLPPAATPRSHYARHAGALKCELKETIPADRLRGLHELRAVRHFLVVGRQLLLLGLSAFAIVTWAHLAWVWIPAALVLGFTVFNFTVLLHEVIHHAVFAKRRPFWERVLGLAYAIPSGISASQFERWHLDHHAELGSWTGDPKRHHLSPKRNARWLKALYFTPALFWIYFRAAGRETATYEPELQTRIARERAVTVLAQLGTLFTIGLLGGWALAVKLYVVPIFFVFPIAFALNRLGQHYDIDPDDPAHWSTLMRPSLFWDRAFLWSNYHLEHHYFPNVPMYRLAELHRALRPLFDRHGMRPRTYRELLWSWLVKNSRPHSDWTKVDS
ncbi:MAG: fatty acid desaturase [Planctomycetota bacterium]